MATTTDGEEQQIASGRDDFISADYWDEFYAEVDEPFDWYSAAELVCDAVYDDFGRRKGKRTRDLHVLDVGCGTATHLFDLARDGFQVTGCDFSKRTVAFAEKFGLEELGPGVVHVRKREDTLGGERGVGGVAAAAAAAEAAETDAPSSSPSPSSAALSDAVDDEGDAAAGANPNGGSLRFVVADARSLPFPDDSFDVILDKGCLDCFISGTGAADVGKYLREAARVLRPGGALLLIPVNGCDIVSLLHRGEVRRNESFAIGRERKGGGGGGTKGRGDDGDGDGEGEGGAAALEDESEEERRERLCWEAQAFARAKASAAGAESVGGDSESATAAAAAAASAEVEDEWEKERNACGRASFGATPGNDGGEKAVFAPVFRVSKVTSSQEKHCFRCVPCRGGIGGIGGTGGDEEGGEVAATELTCGGCGLGVSLLAIPEQCPGCFSRLRRFALS